MYIISQYENIYPRGLEVATTSQLNEVGLLAQWFHSQLLTQRLGVRIPVPTFEFQADVMGLTPVSVWPEVICIDIARVSTNYLLKKIKKTNSVS